MRAIYSAKVKSTSGRRNKRTGQVEEYLVVLFDTGEAQCGCGDYLFHVNTTPEEKYRYRCKHLTRAFMEQDIESSTVTPGPGMPPPPPPSPPTPPSRPTPGLWLDDEDDNPRIRR